MDFSTETVPQAVCASIWKSLLPYTHRMAVTPAASSARTENDAPIQVPPPQQTFRTKSFKYADRLFNGVVGVMSAVHEGFWLGCLNADELNSITAAHFGESRFYTSNEHNLSGFFDWEAEVFGRYFRPGSRLLVAAAGAGREVLALRKAGFEADGFECSLPLVTASQRIFDEFGEPDPVKYCPPDSVPPGPVNHDGLILGWSAYTHVPTKNRRIALLAGLRKRVPSDAPLILSFFTRQNDSVCEEHVYRVGTFCGFFLRRTKETLELGDRIEWRRFVHRFTKDELEGELGTAGFRVDYYREGTGEGHAVAISV